MGACPLGSCIYVADIGDNDAERKRITVYRIPEPSEASGSIAASPDGRWIVLRSANALTFYRAAELQGEGVTFGPDDSVYLMSEGGGRKQPGAFARPTCTLHP